jgi:hypothetical protein
MFVFHTACRKKLTETLVARLACEINKWKLGKLRYMISEVSRERMKKDLAQALSHCPGGCTNRIKSHQALPECAIEGAGRCTVL